MGISNDSAETDPGRDRLGYAPFAKLLAESIEKMTAPKGLVIGIYGEWGSGKTTVVGFIKSYLNASTDASAPLIITFNPWWYTGSEALLVGFFSTLEEEINSNYQSLMKDLGENLRKLSRVLAKVPVDVAGIPEAAFTEFGSGSIQATRDKIIKQLEGLNKRILIVIDDIDRLNPLEIKQLFTVIKAVADFPNVVYLLAFDEKIVTRAISDEYGFDYLEKIVQVPFRLPEASKDKLRAWLMDGLREIVGELPSDLAVNFFGLRGYAIQIINIVDTPRRIIRFLNTFRVTYAGLQKEVHTLDFIILEVIRVFYPDLFQFIADNPELFAGESISAEDIQRYRMQIAAIEKHPTDVDALLIAMFPKLINRHPIEGQYREENIEARRALRIRSKSRFPVYFGFVLKDEQASQADVLDVWSTKSDVSQFTEKIITYAKAKPHKLESLLRQIRDHVYVVLANDMRNLLQGFLDAADEITEPPIDVLGRGRPITDQLEAICLLLMQVLYNQHQVQAIQEILDRTTSTIFALHMIGYVLLRDGNDPLIVVDSAVFDLLTHDEMNVLSDIAIAKLKTLTDASFPVPYIELKRIVARWLEREPDAAHQWLENIFVNPTAFLDFLSSYWLDSRAGSPKNLIDSDLGRHFPVENLIKQVEEQLQQGAYEGRDKAFAEQWLVAAQTL